MTRILALIAVVVLSVSVWAQAVCPEGNFEWKEDGWTDNFCVPYQETVYKTAKEDMPRKGIDFLSTGGLKVADFIKARNEKATGACKTALDKERTAYATAKENFDKEFKKKLPPKEAFDAKKLDDLESKMHKARILMMKYEFQCGDCFLRIAKRWNGETGKLPVYYESDATCLSKNNKKTWLDNGVTYFSRMKNYAKSTDYGLRSIDAYRIFGVKKNDPYEVTTKDFKSTEDPDKQLSFEPKKDGAKFGEHYAFIAVTAPFVYSLGYPYQGWAEYFKPKVPSKDDPKKMVEADIDYSCVMFDTYFSDELRRALDEFKPSPKRVTASGKGSFVTLQKIESAVGSWNFGADGSIRYFTAGDFGKVFSSLGPELEKSMLFPHAIKTIMETVYEAKERLEQELL